MNLSGGLQSGLLALYLAASLPWHARTIPALQQAPIPDVQVLDEASQPASLRSMLNRAGGGPVILLPILTRCSASCPILTRKLDVALTATHLREPYRVVVFSFDPLETTESLRLYRAHEQIPADWKIVRADETEIRRLFEFFRYSIMSQDGTLVHPNEIFMLDSSLNWRWTLVGEDWGARDLAAAITQTASPGLVARINANPERLAWIGFAIALLSFGVAGGWMVWRKPFAQNPVKVQGATSQAHLS